MTHRWWTTLAILAATVPPAAAVPPQFESPQTRPLSVAGDLVLAVNTPDQRLSVFAWNGGELSLLREIRVGLEPIAVAARDDTVAWVTNHLSDDISIVNIREGTVEATVAAGDEPAQVAFLKNPAGGPQDLLAAITLSSEDRVVFHRDTYPFERV
ncbi:MAG: hypothetical protein GF355_17640, partial [Candidatus Eisenbacteria bacterium]|nr:hypothetical protein [Candidatus Eisenbacteria bacterium]